VPFGYFFASFRGGPAVKRLRTGSKARVITQETVLCPNALAPYLLTRVMPSNSGLMQIDKTRDPLKS
jgi:hypothetical protein